MQSITQYNPDVIEQLRQLISDPALFAEYASKLKLRRYQEEVIRAVVSSIVAKSGLSFVVMFPRQSGKNECQAQLEVYLLTICIKFNINIVKISPTWKPQSENAMDRLERTLKGNFLVRDFWKKESGYIYRLGESRCIFMSGSPTASIVGATANLLLEVDEAQDIGISKFDKEIAPMAASTNATRVFWGTAWTSQTLLGRELRAARRAQEEDGIRRVFVLDADQVAQEVPFYGKYVAAQISKLGRNHPMIRTQYFSEEIDAQAGMFPPTRRALMQADRPPHDSPLPFLGEGSGVTESTGSREPCAFLLDVAGQDESRMGVGAIYESPSDNQGRDAISLTIVDLDLSTLATLQAPTYRVAHRLQWTGQNHLTVFGQLKSLAEAWNPMYIVIDATGVGEGMWALLDKAFPGRVIPVKFSQQEKSEIGYRFLAVIETGRFRDLCPTDAVRAQYEACTSEILSGPQKTLRWSVPEGTRGANGELVHDDYLLADALVAVLDRQEWIVQTSAETIEGFDPLKGIERF